MVPPRNNIVGVRRLACLKGQRRGDDDLVIIGRVSGALIIGALIGFERTFHGRPAGFRTHSLVCIASAILMIVTVYKTSG
ncbi:MAG TPA: MgtC/SapB family protein [Bradyrhizobium sp.]|nr:MgtC/SapB family protein [Bradyrhizobium sp.]